MQGRPLIPRRRAKSATLLIAFVSASIFGLGGLGHQASAQTEPKVVRLYVAKRHPQASDDNQGTRRKPLRTIGEAVRRAKKKNRAGLGTHILIRPGTYREEVPLYGDGDPTPAPMKLEGTRRGRVIISGSYRWRGGWQPQADVWWHQWPYHQQDSSYPDGWEESYAGDHLRNNPVIKKRQMLFVDGRHLTQMMTIESLRSSPRDAFYVSDSERRVYIKLAKEGSPNESKVEVAVRPRLLPVTDRRNVTIKHLVFEHANSGVEDFAVFFANSKNAKVIASVFRWNNWTGLHVFASSDVTIRRTTANHNGNAGFTATNARNLRVLRSRTSFNGWRVARGVDREAADQAVDNNALDFAGGHKFFHLRDALFDGHRSIGNKGSGLWLDFDNARVRLKWLELRNNWTQGLHIEANQGPIRVSKSSICGNETGILINNSSRVTVVGNILSDNSLGQLWQAGSDEPRTVYDAYTGKEMQVRSLDWTLLENEIRTADGQLAIGTYISSGWDEFVETLTSDDNRWTYQGATEIFRITGGVNVDFQGWKMHTKQDRHSNQDRHSSFRNKAPRCPSPPTAQLAKDGPDVKEESLPKDGSGMKDKSLAPMAVVWSAAFGFASGAVALLFIRRLNI